MMTSRENDLYVKNFLLTTGSRGSKFDLTNYYLFDFNLLPFARSLRMFLVTQRSPQKQPHDHILALLSRCPISGEGVTTQSDGERSKPGYRQSKVRYPLGLTVIGCLHKQKDPIKPKNPMYCRIWLLFPVRSRVF